ncbi:uncharacterized protein NFIA_059830 [Aspergillus fischeri NRRL 181]|uniref:Uncharacterized protein n=1 Tax=Neosartorya fischeri (strain ATCC 1020 / DSM 3700 / CBS 544.65 / FGSC A1164 / JCM 1740 / NRRL 181 / WB 181) TaxID=331117 RepID=A1DPA7_NEOFI|nr:uncharacterized protein NFIA_059830 [Aspergillus fischeri NRRL 181]EAW16628.1 hypothetical protein NFIA_059830 [Aspergillus fischeri NRRL 181]
MLPKPPAAPELTVQGQTITVTWSQEREEAEERAIPMKGFNCANNYRSVAMEHPCHGPHGVSIERIRGDLEFGYHWRLTERSTGNLCSLGHYTLVAHASVVKSLHPEWIVVEVWISGYVMKSNFNKSVRWTTAGSIRPIHLQWPRRGDP